MPPKPPPETINTILAVNQKGAETVEENPVEDNAENLLPPKISALETVATKFALAINTEDMVEPVAAPESTPSVSRAEPGRIATQWKKGIKLPTSDPNSDDNVRVRRNLAYNIFIPHVEGNKSSLPSPTSTDEVKNSERRENTKIEEAHAGGSISLFSPTKVSSSEAQSISLQLGTADDEMMPRDDKGPDQATNAVCVPQGSNIVSNESDDGQKLKEFKPSSFSPTRPAGTTFANVFRGEAKEFAPLDTIPNLTKPDLDWAPKAPITFASSASTSLKNKVTPPRSARLLMGVPEMTSNITQTAEPASIIGQLDFNWASEGGTGFTSSRSSSSSEHSVQTPSTKSNADSFEEAVVDTKYPQGFSEPEMRLQTHDQGQPTTRAWSRLLSSSEEMRTAEAQQLRRRVEAAILKEQIKRAFEAKRAREIQEATAPKAGKEEKGVHKGVAASQTSDRKTGHQAAKAQRESTTASLAAIKHQARQMGNPADDEFSFQIGPTNREKRAQAFKQSQTRKMEAEAAAKERMKIEEERRLAETAAAPILSTAAKRRSRARRNAGGKSWADEAMT